MFTRRYKAAKLAREKERYELLCAIQETKDRLQVAQREFESVSAPELVEASVYEIKSLQARYAYYIRIAKDEQTTLGGGTVFRPSLKASAE